MEYNYYKNDNYSDNQVKFKKMEYEENLEKNKKEDILFNNEKIQKNIVSNFTTNT